MSQLQRTSINTDEMCTWIYQNESEIDLKDVYRFYVSAHVPCLPKATIVTMFDLVDMLYCMAPAVPSFLILYTRSCFIWGLSLIQG